MQTCPGIQSTCGLKRRQRWDERRYVFVTSWTGSGITRDAGFVGNRHRRKGVSGRPEDRDENWGKSTSNTASSARAQSRDSTAPGTTTLLQYLGTKSARRTTGGLISPGEASAEGLQGNVGGRTSPDGPPGLSVSRYWVISAGPVGLLGRSVRRTGAASHCRRKRQVALLAAPAPPANLAPSAPDGSGNSVSRPFSLRKGAGQ